MGKIKAPFVAAAMLLTLPCTAYANAGTVLMWVGGLHLMFGNALIGVFEGLLLAVLFGGPRLKSIFLLIAANYASAWIGGVFLLGYLTKQIDMTIVNAEWWFYILVVIAFVLTLLIEFPFFLLALRKTSHFFRRALVAVLLIHGISYLVLAGVYRGAAAVSMMTQLTVLPAEQMDLPEGLKLYYVSPEGRILRSDLSGEHQEELKAADSRDRIDRLFARKNNKGSYDLLALLLEEKDGTAQEALILEDFSRRAPIDTLIADGYSTEATVTVLHIGPVPKITADDTWEYTVGFWSAEGISGTSSKENARFYFAMETPFADWRVRNATHLEGDFVAFQLGDDQICLLQPQRRQIALVARGRGPIVAQAKED